MSKQLVFISHITEEKELAIAFKELVEKSFLGMIDVFVSSDAGSISVGRKWLDDITSALKTCAVEIVLCSPRSVTRPWINFEAGAGWIRDIPVIPLCHSGMEPSSLPLPLNLLQAAKAGDAESLRLILPVLAKAIGSNIPTVDFDEFVKRVKVCERRYVFWDECSSWFRKLDKVNPKIRKMLYELNPGRRIDLLLTETQIQSLEGFAEFMRSNNILEFEPKSGEVQVRPNGTFYSCVLKPLADLQSTITNPDFK